MNRKKHLWFEAGIFSNKHFWFEAGIFSGEDFKIFLMVIYEEIKFLNFLTIFKIQFGKFEIAFGLKDKNSLI